MKALKEICKKGGRYKEMIKESRLVKNAIILLGGRRRGNGGEREGMEGEEGEEEKGGVDEMECVAMNVGEKISLIELLSELVKGGMEIGEEEEMKEVLMELEEEGNKHVEEEREGEGEEKEEEKREWEELSEKARNLVWVIEKMKNRREGKKSGTWKMMKKEKEEMEKNLEEERRGREEEKKRADEAEGRIERMKMEIKEMKKKEGVDTQTSSDTPPLTPIASTVITSLDKTSVLFTPTTEGTMRLGNTIIHPGGESYRNCFIGEEMTSV